MTVRFVKYDKYFWAGKQPKLALTFMCIDFGDGFETEIQAHYRLDRIDKKKRCWSRPKSRIVRDLGRLFPDYVDEQPLPLTRLTDVIATARTKVITTDRDGIPLAPQQHYEIIDYFKGVNDV